MSDIPVLERVLFSQEQLAARCAELGRQISADYRGKQRRYFARVHFILFRFDEEHQRRLQYGFYVLIFLCGRNGQHRSGAHDVGFA